MTQAIQKFSIASWLRRLAAVSLVLAFAAPAAATPNDAWITTKIKLALVTTDGITASGANAINVDTVNRQVTLHGTVSTAPEKEKAERVAKAVDGVQGVRNLLVVVAPKRQEAVSQADDIISRDVALALTDEDELGDSNISVQSVNKGVVLLKGTARTLADHLTAVEIAGSINGVRRVASEIESPDTLADADLWKERPTVGNVGKAPSPGHVENEVAVNAVRNPATGESVNPNVNVDNTRAAASYGKADDPAPIDSKIVAARAAKPDDKADDAAGAQEPASAPRPAASDATAKAQPSQPSGAAGDLYTTSMVKMRLLANDQTPAMEINVDTHGSVVTLFGIVPDEKSKASAESEARQVAGVKNVKNELQVVASAKKEAVTARDDEIETNLQKSLGERVALKDVEIDVKNCVARLSGTVPSGIERLEAMQVARGTRGVCSVKKNDLHVNN